MKANQPTLYEGIALLFREPGARLETTRQQDYHGDRQEVRQLRVSSALNEWADWPSLAQVGELIHTWRRKGERRREVSYLITSLPRQAAGPRIDRRMGHPPHPSNGQREARKEQV